MAKNTQIAPGVVHRQAQETPNVQIPQNSIELDSLSPEARDELQIPIGTIISYGADDVPTGYFLCDGSAVDRGDFDRLFAIIGEAWGEGDGSTTFNLPDLRGEFLRGHDEGAGNDPDAGSRTAKFAGGATGDNVGSFQDDEFQSHTHFTPSQQIASAGAINDVAEPIPPGGNFISTSATGGSETRPRNAYVKFVIKF